MSLKKIVSNFGDEIISIISPETALNRKMARKSLEKMAFESADVNRYRSGKRESRSINTVNLRSAETLRSIVRHREENDDVTIAVLNELIKGVVGSGFEIEPLIKDKKGKIITSLNREIQEQFLDCTERVDVTNRFSYAEYLKMAFRTFIRDGEVFKQRIIGERPGLIKKDIPFYVELIEPEMCPIYYNEEVKGIRQGVQLNNWNRATKYFFHKRHPSEYINVRDDFKESPQAIIDHWAYRLRANQVRGITIFHAVLNRLEDLKDYEESERIAARVSAALGLYIKKGKPEDYMDPDDEGKRYFDMAPGMVLDDLRPGEDIGVMASTRPSQLLQSFRDSQQKSVSAATNTNYSSLSRNYNGSYSAKRQELIDSYRSYGVLQKELVAQIIKPDYRDFLKAYMAVANLSKVALKEIDPKTLFKFQALGPQMPWIDPIKESAANEKDIRLGITSKSRVQRSKGINPDRELEAIEAERRAEEAKKLPFTSNPAYDIGQDVIDDILKESSRDED